MQMTHHLDDKYTATSGSAFMTGTQALVRLPMAQMRRDHQAGNNTAAFITGYRGSPLGAYDQQLIKARDHLDALDITFQPGVNNAPVMAGLAFVMGKGRVLIDVGMCSSMLTLPAARP